MPTRTTILLRSRVTLWIRGRYDAAADRWAGSIRARVVIRRRGRTPADHLLDRERRLALGMRGAARPAPSRRTAFR